MISIVTALVLWLVGAVAVAVGVAALFRQRATTASGTSAQGDKEGAVAFLFRDGQLIDATEAARPQMPAEPAESNDLARFAIAFGQRFEGLADMLAGLAQGNRAEIAEVPEDPGSLRLVAERSAGQLRITLEDPLEEQRSETLTHYSIAAMRSELFTLRSIAERSPMPTWKQRNDGCVIWANSRYMTLARTVAGEEALIGWPPPDLFDAAVLSKANAFEAPLRVSLPVRPDAPPAWFDLIALPGEIETLYFAMPIDKLVRAENALTEFVQTLTKTFADLRVGLAIFDSRRKLVLFNPALVDLTGLQAEQLSSRPSLHAFLDALRDYQRIPEPKDYKSWRMQIAHLEAGAADGTFEETWHLPTGQTFRVSGRPHPDGAVAYLFEDISVEMSMTRDFRAKIDLSQAVIDSLDVAVAAFSAAGDLAVCNAAYKALWKQSLHTGLSQMRLREAASIWTAQCKQGAATEELENAVLRGKKKLPWKGDVTLLDGTIVSCSLRPLAGGALLTTFGVKGRCDPLAQQNGIRSAQHLPV